MTEKSEDIKGGMKPSEELVDTNDFKNSITQADDFKARDCLQSDDDASVIRRPPCFSHQRKLQIEIQKHSIINIFNTNEFEGINPEELDNRKHLSIDQIERNSPQDVKKGIQNSFGSESVDPNNDRHNSQLEIEFRNLENESETLNPEIVNSVSPKIETKEYGDNQCDRPKDLEYDDRVSSMIENKSPKVNQNNEIEEILFGGYCSDLLIPSATSQMEGIDCDVSKIEMKSSNDHQDEKGAVIPEDNVISHSQIPSEILLSDSKNGFIWETFDEGNQRIEILPETDIGKTDIISKTLSEDLDENHNEENSKVLQDDPFSDLRKINEESPKENQIGEMKDMPWQSSLNDSLKCSNTLPTKTIFTNISSKTEKDLFKNFENDESVLIEDPNNTVKLCCIENDDKDLDNHLSSEDPNLVTPKPTKRKFLINDNSPQTDCEANLGHLDSNISENDNISDISFTYKSMNPIFSPTMVSESELDNQKQLKSQKRLQIDSQSNSIFNTRDLDENVEEDDKIYSFPIEDSEPNHLQRQDRGQIHSPDISSTYENINSVFQPIMVSESGPENQKQLTRHKNVQIDSQSDSILDDISLNEEVAEGYEIYSIPITTTKPNDLINSAGTSSTYQDINSNVSPVIVSESRLNNGKIESQRDSMLRSSGLHEKDKEDYVTFSFPVDTDKPKHLTRHDKLQIDGESELGLDAHNPSNNKKAISRNSNLNETEILSTSSRSDSMEHNNLYVEMCAQSNMENSNLHPTISLPKSSSSHNLEYHKKPVVEEQGGCSTNARIPPKPLPRHKILPVNVQKPERPSFPPKITNTPIHTKECPPRPMPIPAPRTKRISSLNDMVSAEYNPVENEVADHSDSTNDEAINKTPEKESKLKKYKKLFGKFKTRIKSNLKPETNEKLPTKFYFN